MAEITIHRSLKHENIVDYKHAFEDEENVYIILELCDNRVTILCLFKKKTCVELLKSKKRLKEDELRTLIPQILNALKYMHDQNVIHRKILIFLFNLTGDLKLGNLFLTKEMKIKIGDYGLAARVTQEGERKKYSTHSLFILKNYLWYS